MNQVKMVGQGILKLLIKNVFSNLTLVTLTFDPVTPKSIQFLCYPGCICGPSFKKVGWGVLEIVCRLCADFVSTLYELATCINFNILMNLAHEMSTYWKSLLVKSNNPNCIVIDTLSLHLINNMFVIQMQIESILTFIFLLIDLWITVASLLNVYISRLIYICTPAISTFILHVCVYLQCFLLIFYNILNSLL